MAFMMVQLVDSTLQSRRGSGDCGGTEAIEPENFSFEPIFRCGLNRFPQVLKAERSAGDPFDDRCCTCGRCLVTLMADQVGDRIVGLVAEPGPDRKR